jgi:hypothetical protein
MRRWILAALVAGLLPACTPVPSLQERLQVWIGRSEVELVGSFGVPAGTYEVDGVKFLSFVQQRTRFVPGDYPFHRPFGRFGPITGPTWSSTILVSCQVTFALRRGVVESFSFRGDGCG